MGILQRALSVIVRKAMLTAAIAAGKKILGKAVAPTDDPIAQSHALDAADKPSDFLASGDPLAKADIADAEVAAVPKKSNSSKARSRSPRKQTKTTTSQDEQASQEAAPQKPTRSRKPAQSAKANEAVTETADPKPKKPRAPRKKTPPTET